MGDAAGAIPVLKKTMREIFPKHGINFIQVRPGIRQTLQHLRGVGQFEQHVELRTRYRPVSTCRCRCRCLGGQRTRPGERAECTEYKSSSTS